MIKEKDNLNKKVIETYSKLQDNLQTSLEAMYSTISNLNNTVSEENEGIKPYEDCRNDIKDKIEIIGKISEGLKENIEIINKSKGNDKHILKVKKYVKISELTNKPNKEDLLHYFYSMKIYGFIQIDIEIKKDWWGIFFTICLGALEITAGCILLFYTGGQFGSELIDEGYDDVKYGVKCLIGTKEFSWSDFKKKKINFSIRTTVNITIKLLTGGFSNFSKTKKSNVGLKGIFKEVGKKIIKKAVKDIGKSLNLLYWTRNNEKNICKG